MQCDDALLLQIGVTNMIGVLFFIILVMSFSVLYDLHTYDDRVKAWKRSLHDEHR